MRSILSSAASSQKLILARGRGREERKTEEPISALLAGTKEIFRPKTALQLLTMTLCCQIHPCACTYWH